MANAEHLDLLLQGVEGWNQWRKENRAIEIDLRGADLRRASLGSCNLSGANLGEVNLGGANLSEADMSGADLRRADLMAAYIGVAKLVGANLNAIMLSGATLTGADLSGADLTGARLIGAKLSEVNLTRVNLSGAVLFRTDLHAANLREAYLGQALLFQTAFDNLDLSQAKGLELCEHRGPSSIGIDTLFKSQGNIPEVFLRGCGVPEQFITYAQSLVGKAIEFYSCFISYSTKDQAFADRLHADLQNKGVRCWFAPHKVQGGKKLHEQIDEAIRIYDRLLLILSDASMDSEWVKTEIAKARKRETREKKRMLFPVRLVEFSRLRDWECFDGDTGKDSAREVREYYVPDFSNWKDHDSYQVEFQKLIRDLKTELPTPSPPVSKP
jgi:uncharacterized protein YjbI with pentapeptide repeats